MEITIFGLDEFSNVKNKFLSAAHLFFDRDSTHVNCLQEYRVGLVSGRIFENLAYPLSRRELWLRTRDPPDNRLVRYSYYKHPQDLKICVNDWREGDG